MSPAGRCVRSLGFGSALFLGLSLPRAIAHPFGQQYFGLRSELRMKAEGPELVVAGEVPIGVVLGEFRHFFRGVVRPGPAEDAAYMQSKLDELRQGLALQVDGGAIEGAWVALDDGRNGKSAEGSFTYFLVFEPAQPWDLSAPQIEVELIADAYQGVPLWFSAFAGVEPPDLPADGSGWRVSENSARALLGDAADDPQGSQRPSGWSQDQSMRRWRVVFQHVSPESPKTQQPPLPTAGGGCMGW